MYDDYNDQELLYLICESNEDATNILYDKYQRGDSHMNQMTAF